MIDIDGTICDDIPNVNVYECKSEKELLLKWKDLMLYHNPDLFTGYNIFGFDYSFYDLLSMILICNCQLYIIRICS